MKGITNIGGFDKSVKINDSYYDEISNLILRINLNYRNILNNIEGKTFDFLRDNSVLQNLNRDFISSVIGSYSDSLKNVRNGYFYQDHIFYDSISNR